MNHPNHSRRPARPRNTRRQPSYPRCLGVGLSAGLISLVAACGSEVEVHETKGGGGSTTSQTGPGGGLMGIDEDPWDGGGATAGSGASNGGAGGVGGAAPGGAGGQGAGDSSDGGMAGVPSDEYQSS